MKFDDTLQMLDQHINRLKTSQNEMNGLLTNIRDSFKKAEENQKELRATIQQLESQSSSLIMHVQKLETETSVTEKNISDQQGIQNQLNETINRINTEISTLKETKETLQKDINLLESKIIQSEADLKEKQETKNNLLKNLDSEVDQLKSEVSQLKTDHNNLMNNFSGLSFLLSSGLLEIPEVEILSIIAENRPVEQEQLKSMVKSVSPVLVSRTITKLEADGKILNNNGKLDITPSLIEILN